MSFRFISFANTYKLRLGSFVSASVVSFVFPLSLSPSPMYSVYIISKKKKKKKEEEEEEEEKEEEGSSSNLYRCQESYSLINISSCTKCLEF